MKTPLVAVAALLTFLASPALAQEPAQTWEVIIEALEGAETTEGRQAALQVAIGLDVDEEAVASVLRRGRVRMTDETGIVLRRNMCGDGVERPYAMYIPEGYDPYAKMPLLVALHGGVSRGALVEDPVDYASGTAYYELARDRGMAAIWPIGQLGATWWDPVGIENVHAQINLVKRELRIDDDRIYMIGYSDGASAAFAWAMTQPSKFAAFFALSGHMGVGNQAGEMATFAPNLSNTPVYAVTSFEDSLYPSKTHGPVIDMAIAAGANIFYREQEGPHNFSYAEAELPLISSFLDRHPRNPYPAKISWEASDMQYGRCHWLSIDSVDEDAEPAAWHTDYNYELTSDRITIGFSPDAEYKGDGMRLSTVSDGSFASEVGLLPGDILVRADEVAVVTSADLNRWKAGVARGDEVQIEVSRDGEQLILDGALPPVDRYNLFNDRGISGRANASFAGNRVDIETSRVGSLSLLIDPNMFRLDRPVTVTINGTEVFQGLVEWDREFMLRNFLAERDRSFLPVAKLTFEL